MSAYRKPVVYEPPEHVGPRKACPFCGAAAERGQSGRYGDYSPVEAPRACSGSWWRACSRRDAHLHQSCKVCGGAWTCAPVEAP